jgi:hypothetical protein
MYLNVHVYGYEEAVFLATCIALALPNVFRDAAMIYDHVFLAWRMYMLENSKENVFECTCMCTWKL